MASIGKPKIPVKASDLKQAVLKKNRGLESRNKTLGSSIKNKEGELKSLEKECSSRFKEVGKLQKEIEFQEDRLQKINGGVYSNDKLLKVKLKAISGAESELCEYESSTEKLEDKMEKLKKEIEALEFYKAQCSESKKELAGLQIKKDSALSELDEIEDEIDKTSAEAAKKILYYDNQYDVLEEKAKKHEDMVHQFEQRLFEAKDQSMEEESKLRALLNKSKAEKEQAEKELQAVKNLVEESEDKYVEIEQKVNKMSDKADKEEGRIGSAKKRYEAWRIGILEEVARMKLKKKVDNIDKAGLSEILNG